jgi:molybdopterin/thiamine biosynthesis adenylyltransferase
MGVIRMPEGVLTELTAHLDRRGEHFAFLIATLTWSQGEPVFMVKRVHLVPDDQTSWVRDGHEVSTDAMIAAINLAVRERAALIEVHNHRGPSPRWSATDREGLEETVPYMLGSLPGRPYGAAVWGGGELSGDWFAQGGLRGEFRSALVVGSSLRQLISREDDADGEPGFARQEPWFTAAGQRQLGQLRVGIIGNSGTGSPLIQNLVYLGLHDFVLVEPDSSDPTSMNRLVTATAADVGTPKAILGRRLIRSVAPTAEVQVFETDLRATAALDALRGVDLLFGCVDNDGARLVLNEFAVAYGIPYFDLAVGIDAENGQVQEAGGRVALVLPGGPCLWCMDEIDVEEASYFLAAEAERAERRRLGYVKGMDVPAPSVISLNAAIAAAAVNELAVWVSEAREVSRFVEIDLLGKGRKVASQWMTPRQVEQDPGCVQCLVAGLGDAAHLVRYELSA